MAAPARYTAEIADHILCELRRGRPLCRVCGEDGMPHPDTVTNWVKQDREGFAARFREARQIGRRHRAERVLDELMRGRTLLETCGGPDMPDPTTVSRWAAADRDGFGERYRSARQVGRLHQAAIHYSEEIAESILDALMSGLPLEHICSDPDMPAACSVRQWVKHDRDGFAARYREAREIGCHAIADEMLRIVDDRRNDWIVWCRDDGRRKAILDPLRTERAEARIKARRWLLSKLLPKTFDKQPAWVARQEAEREYQRDLAEMREIFDGRTRGLPSEDEEFDEE